MATKTRLYRVVHNGVTRLIEASTPHRARSFAAQDIIVDIPAQHEVYQMASQGIKLEVAGDEPASDETRASVAQTVIPETLPAPTVNITGYVAQDPPAGGIVGISSAGAIQPAASGVAYGMTQVARDAVAHFSGHGVQANG